MIGLYLVALGAWIAGVGYHGNSAESLKFISEQKQYVVWLVAIVILYMLYQVDTIRPVVKPFIILALVALVLRDWAVIKGQLSETASELGL